MSWHLASAILGWVGAALLMAGYWLVSTRRVTGDGPVFQLLNIGGSAGLGVAAVAGGVWSAATLNGIWVGIGCAVLTRRAARRTGTSKADGTSKVSGVA